MIPPHPRQAPGDKAAAPGPVRSGGGEEPQRPGRYGWRPWHGRARARDVLCVLAIALSGLYAIVTIPLVPALIATHPVLLELLTGSGSAVVAAGAFTAMSGKLLLVVVVAAGVPGMMRFDWVFWWAGKLWGHRIVAQLSHRNTRAAALVGLIERRGRGFAGPLVALSAFLPSGSSAAVYAAAGWLGLPLLPFLLYDAIGTACWVALLAELGRLLGSSGVHLADLVSRYTLVSVCVLAAATIAPAAWRAWRERSRAAARDQAAASPPLAAAPPDPGVQAAD